MQYRFQELLIPIISRLLSGVHQIADSNLEDALPALMLISNILDKLDSDESLGIDTEQLKKSLESFNTFYVDTSNFMQEHDKKYHNDITYKMRNETFSKTSQILFRIQKYASPEDIRHMPEWLQKVIECARSSQGKIALISIKTFLDILQADDDPTSSLFFLQTLIVREGTNEKLDRSESNNEILQRTENQTCKLIIKNLWQQLNNDEDHEVIVELLKEFDFALPALFQEVVINELESPSREVKMKAIAKFNIFWKITSKDYPQYTPFLKEDRRHGNRRCMPLHTMLQILEDFDPTLRLTCKSWLNDSQENFKRIIDPLVEEFLENSQVFMTFYGQIFFMDHYDTGIIIQNFGKLRNIILNTQEKLILYMQRNEPTDRVKVAFSKIFHFAEIDFGKLNYLQMIVLITL